jgi:hypothetical protein
MRYNPNQYSSGFSICALLIAGMFFYWGVDALFIQSFWHFGINWMGFVWFAIGAAILGNQIAALVNRSKLRNTVLLEFKLNPNISAEVISANTGISVGDVRAIILDLKASGMLRGQFSSSTGQAKSMEVVQNVEVHNIPQEKSEFCSNCGTPIEHENAAFCAYCGSKL